MDTAAQWPQEIIVKPIEEIVTNTCPRPVQGGGGGGGLERKIRPQKEQALNCPRCNSTNTKFCYYNNYSLTQPRYFCKTCRRYWTEGGSLRNIPVGGGSRKNKRSSSSSPLLSNNNSNNNSSSCSFNSSKKLPDLVSSSSSSHHHQNPNNKMQEGQGQGQDLNLAFPHHHQGITSFTELIQLPNGNNNKNTISNSTTSVITTAAAASAAATTAAGAHQISALELLTGISSRGFNSFMPIQDPNYTSGAFGVGVHHDFKPSLNFSLDGLGNGYGSLHHHHHHHHQGVQETGNGRLLFPFEDLKQVSTTTTEEIEQNNNHNNRDQGDSTGFWTATLGGGGGGGSW